jgi:hypothetical protein
MIVYLPIKPHDDILPMDLLKSPMGHHYKVICKLDNEIVKLTPLDIYNDSEFNMDFSIIKRNLFEAGWKKRMA